MPIDKTQQSLVCMQLMDGVNVEMELQLGGLFIPCHVIICKLSMLRAEVCLLRGEHSLCDVSHT